MQNKYRGPETEYQLWDQPDLQSSSYDVGTQITDHFEVLTKTPDSIVVRCGGSPRIREVRPGEGLFEMYTHINEQEGVVEFGMKSAFFQGAGKNATGNPPMPAHIKWLHVQYAKLWMETAVRNVTVWKVFIRYPGLIWGDIFTQAGIGWYQLACKRPFLEGRVSSFSSSHLGFLYNAWIFMIPNRENHKVK